MLSHWEKKKNRKPNDIQHWRMHIFRGSCNCWEILKLLKENLVCSNGTLLVILLHAPLDRFILSLSLSLAHKSTTIFYTRKCTHSFSDAGWVWWNSFRRSVLRLRIRTMFHEVTSLYILNTGCILGATKFQAAMKARTDRKSEREREREWKRAKEQRKRERNFTTISRFSWLIFQPERTLKHSTPWTELIVYSDNWFSFHRRTRNRFGRVFIHSFKNFVDEIDFWKLDYVKKKKNSARFWKLAASGTNIYLANVNITTVSLFIEILVWRVKGNQNTMDNFYFYIHSRWNSLRMTNKNEWK